MKKKLKLSAAETKLREWLTDEQIMELDNLAIGHKISIFSLCKEIRDKNIMNLIKNTNVSYTKIAKKYNISRTWLYKLINYAKLEQ